jgi:hypothetical protein
MTVVARARLLSLRTLPSVQALSSHIRKTSGDLRPQPASLLDDPLCQWFSRRTSSEIRSIECAIRALLVGSRPLNEVELADSMSDLAAFFYVALFRTVRRLVRSFQTSNPTWIKVAKNQAETLRLSVDTVWNAFFQSVEEMSASATVPALVHDPRCIKARVAVADSRAMPLDTGSVDAILTSPPYCTRIDYAVATRPELAVLGQDGASFSRMRNRLLGTTAVCAEPASVPLPAVISGFLDVISGHKSKASSTYYRRSFEQYFQSMHLSLVECRRVIRPGGSLFLVVQDSYYKDVHVDLSSLLIDLGNPIGWATEERTPFPVLHNMARINPRVRRYRHNITATEWCIKMRAA